MQQPAQPYEQQENPHADHPIHGVNDRICRMLAQHDQHGIDLLYDVYYRQLVLWADTFLDSMAASEDLVQELFIDIWARKLYLKFRSDALPAFLRMIVRNRCLNHKNKRGVVYSTMEVEKVTIALDNYNDGHDQILAAIVREIDLLHPRSRQILRAVYLEGMKYREVAERYDISVSTVKTLISRSLDSLRSKLFKVDTW
jgi:RNA polymerase sigma-70 factor (ECF subfamily)